MTLQQCMAAATPPVPSHFPTPVPNPFHSPFILLHLSTDLFPYPVPASPSPPTLSSSPSPYRFDMNPEEVLDNVICARAHNSEQQMDLLSEAAALMSDSRWVLALALVLVSVLVLQT